jgi:putative DNA primase/helicase
MMSAHDLTIALRGRWNIAANRGSARCPCHDDSTPSLTLRDGDKLGRILVHCFAGCDHRDILAVLRQRGLLEGHESQAEARRELTGKSLPVGERPCRNEPPPALVPDPEAIAIWAGASRAAGSIVERYLRARGITIAPPPSLRCAGGRYLEHAASAMVAAVQAPDRRTIAVQVTRLEATGERKAQVPLPRLTVGALGNGAVRLAAAADVLGLAEGIETALSAMQLTGVPTWACLGASRMHRVAVPDGVRELHIFTDNDDPGQDAAERTAHAHQHRRVVLRRPPDGLGDWNDFLRTRGIAA